MVDIRKRIYIIGFIILGLILLSSAIFVWDLVAKHDKQQDKIYSGAKLVYSAPGYSTLGNGFDGQ